MTDDGSKRTWERASLPAETRVSMRAEGREFHGNIVDISHSGLLIACGEQPAVGTALTLDFAHGDRAVQGKVQVVRHSRDPEPAGIAVTLEYTTFEDRLSLDALLDAARAALADDEG